MRSGSAELVGQRAIARAARSRFGVGNARFRYTLQAGWVDTVYLGAWQREVFDRVGRFRRRARSQPGRRAQLPDRAGRRSHLVRSRRMRTRYEVRAPFLHCGSSTYGYGLFKVRVIQKRRAVASWRQVVPPLFVGCRCSSTVIIGRARLVKPKLILVVVAPYLTANTAASVHAARDDPGELAVLPFVFATLHFAYGRGIPAGVWKWRRFHRSAGRREHTVVHGVELLHHPRPREPLGERDVPQHPCRVAGTGWSPARRARRPRRARSG